jgi:hypothetical protein
MVKNKINILIDYIDPVKGIRNNVLGKLDDEIVTEKTIIPEMMEYIFDGYDIKYIPSFFVDEIDTWIYPIVIDFYSYSFMNSLFTSGHIAVSIRNHIPKRVKQLAAENRGKICIIIREPVADIEKFINVCTNHYSDFIFLLIHHVDANNIFTINTAFNLNHYSHKPEVSISTYDNRNFSLFLTHYEETIERHLLLSFLEKSNLISKGFISAKNNGKDFDKTLLKTNRSKFPNQKASFTSYDDVFDYLPIKDTLNKTLFNIVIDDTLLDEKYIIITEKIYRCFEEKKPFLLYAQKNTLKHLNNLGYKTFASVINEDYDSYETPEERFKAFLKEIHRLSNKTYTELSRDIDKLYDILEHNKEHIKKLRVETTDKIFNAINHSNFN